MPEKNPFAGMNDGPRKPTFKGSTLGDLPSFKKAIPSKPPLFPTAIPRAEKRNFSGFLDQHVAEVEAQREENKEIFDKLLKGKFASVEKNFRFIPTRTPLVESILLTPSDSGKSLFAVVSYRRPGGLEAHTTLSITPRGDLTLMEPLPKALEKLNVDDLYSDILDQVERFEIGKWKKTSVNLKTVIDDNQELGLGSDPEQIRTADREDKERMKLLMDQPGLLYKAVSRANGFTDYRLFVFRNGCVLEHPMTNHAGYVIPFDGSIDPEYTAKKFAQLSDEEADAVLATIPGSERISLPRSEKIKAGATRIVHPQSGSWKKKMLDSIAKMLQRQG